MATWPSSLPQCVMSAARAFQYQDGAIRSQPDTGPIKARPRFTAVMKIYQIATKHLTADKLATFEDFYETTLGNGALEFTWTDPVTGDPAQCQFLEAPQISYLGSGKWSASFKMAVLP